MRVERTERAIEACYDSVLAPAEWPRALQLLAESLGAESCTFFSEDEEVPPKMPISTEHAEFHELWLRNECDAPDPSEERPHSAGHAPDVGFWFSAEVSWAVRRWSLN